MKIHAEALERAKKIKLIIFDVDGVLTDGGIYLSGAGEVFKPFHCRDGLGIALAHTVGLKNDGTVVCTAIGKDDNNKGQCEVSGWTDIKAVSAGKYHTVALKNDGTVLSTSMDEDDEENKGQCDISGWTDVTAICAGVRNTVALKSDGTVLAAGDGSYGLTEINDRKVN